MVGEILVAVVIIIVIDVESSPLVLVRLQLLYHNLPGARQTMHLDSVKSESVHWSVLHYPSVEKILQRVGKIPRSSRCCTEETFGVVVGGVRKHVRCWALFYNLTLIHDGYVVTNLSSNAKIMGDKQYGKVKTGLNVREQI